MKGQKTELARAVLISRGYWDVPVRVRLQPFVQFCRRLDGQLDDLVGRWEHLAAPRAAWRGRRRG